MIAELQAGRAALEATLAAATEARDRVEAERDTLAAERDRYKELYVKQLELCRKLELGILGQKSERFIAEGQLTLSLLGMLLGEAEAQVEPPPTIEVDAHERPKPTGRKPLPEHLPRVDVTVLPEEVERGGLDAFERIGEDVTETVERRPGSFVVVRVHRPKFVPKGRDPLAETKVSQMPALELPIPRGLAGPGLLADTLVRRFQDHQPLHRLERIYGREGLELARSTLCGWHAELSALVRPLIEAMWQDALAASCHSLKERGRSIALIRSLAGSRSDRSDNLARLLSYIRDDPCSGRNGPNMSPTRWSYQRGSSRTLQSGGPSPSFMRNVRTVSSSKLSSVWLKVA